jgi:hypothetical protein
MALAGVIAVACDPAQPAGPAFDRPLFAAAATTPVTASGTLSITDPGTQWLSDGVVHTRHQTQSGPVNGDITGSITVTGKSDVTLPEMNGTGSGRFTITTDQGSWKGRFEGTFQGGMFSGQIVAHGTGAYAGSVLRGNISQMAANRSYVLTGTILKRDDDGDDDRDDDRDDG